MNPEFAQGVTAWLLTYAVHSTVLLGLVWLIHRVRQLDPGASDIFWKVALAGGVLTASIQTSIDHRPAGTLALAAVPALAPISLPPITAGETGGLLPRSETAQPNRQVGNSTPSILQGATSSASPASIATLAWLAIAGLLVLAYVGRRLVLIGRLGDRRVVADENVRGLLAELNQHSSRTMSVRLTTSTAISSPVALGRSEICLPTAALVELEPAQQRAMLAHELAHLERSDPMWLAFACLMERAFFFQPLNGLARRRMQESAEYLCDEIAASRSGGVPLARCLVKVAEWIQASPLGVPVAGMAEERSQLAARVVRLLESGQLGVRRSRRTLTVASVVVLMAMVAVVPGVAGRARPGLPTQPTYEKSEKVDGNKAAVPATNPTAPLDATPVMSDNDVGIPLAGKNPEHQSGAIIVKEDTAVVRALMARLRDEDAGVRAAAANALGRIGDPMAIPALVSSLEDPSKEVRYAAVSALGNFDEGVPVGPLRKLLKSDDAEMRHQVAHMLGNMEDRESAPALALLISDLSVDVRIAAIEALGNLGVTTISDAIRAAMVDVNAEVRRSAIEALDNLEIKFNEAEILRGLNDPDADVRDAAVEIAGSQRIVAAVPMLIRLLDDPNSEVRQCSAEALAEIRNDAARAALRRALEHQDPEVRRVAVDFFGEDKDR